jgi:hypothetical protein
MKDKVAEVKRPVTDEEIKNRHHDYPFLSPFILQKDMGNYFNHLN